MWKGAVTVANCLEILCCEENMNDRSDLMERVERLITVFRYP